MGVVQKTSHGQRAGRGRYPADAAATGAMGHNNPDRKQYGPGRRVLGAGREVVTGPGTTATLPLRRQHARVNTGDGTGGRGDARQPGWPTAEQRGGGRSETARRRGRPGRTHGGRRAAGGGRRAAGGGRRNNDCSPSRRDEATQRQDGARPTARGRRPRAAQAGGRPRPDPQPRREGGGTAVHPPRPTRRGSRRPGGEAWTRDENDDRTAQGQAGLPRRGEVGHPASTSPAGEQTTEHAPSGTACCPAARWGVAAAGRRPGSGGCPAGARRRDVRARQDAGQWARSGPGVPAARRHGKDPGGRSTAAGVFEPGACGSTTTGTGRPQQKSDATEAGDQTARQRPTRSRERAGQRAAYNRPATQRHSAGRQNGGARPGIGRRWGDGRPPRHSAARRGARHGRIRGSVTWQRAVGKPASGRRQHGAVACSGLGHGRHGAGAQQLSGSPAETGTLRPPDGGSAADGRRRGTAGRSATRLTARFTMRVTRSLLSRSASSVRSLHAC